MPRLRKTGKSGIPRKPLISPSTRAFIQHLEKVGRKVERPKKVITSLGPTKVVPASDETICVAARERMREVNTILRALLERRISTEVVRSTEDGGPFTLKFTKSL